MTPWDDLTLWAKVRFALRSMPAFARVWFKLAWMVLAEPALRTHLSGAVARRAWWSLAAMEAALTLGLVKGVLVISALALAWELSTMVFHALSVGLAGPDPQGPGPAGPEDLGPEPPPDDPTGP